MDNVETNKGLMEKCGSRIFDGKNRKKPLHLKKDLDGITFSNKKNPYGILNCIPMDKEWRKWCKGEWWGQENFENALLKHPKLDKRLFEIRKRLLSFGGETACIPAYPDADTDLILNFGQFWLGNNVRKMSGEIGKCHRNSCELWEANPEITRICTGFALTEDGMWREHSWVIWLKPRSTQIVETTPVSRIAYYGYVMTEEQCRVFAEDNF
jgi:hypothetical protein